MIRDSGALRHVLEASTDQETTLQLLKSAKAVLEQIRKLPPTIEPDECGKELSRIGAMSMDWQRGDDTTVRKELGAISQRLDRMRRFKSGGIEALPSEISGPLKEFVGALKRIGIFLAPIGELEGWFAPEEVQASRSNKPAWANAAALKIQLVGAQRRGIWDFVREVGGYLHAQREQET